MYLQMKARIEEELSWSLEHVRNRRSLAFNRLTLFEQTYSYIRWYKTLVITIRNIDSIRAAIFILK